MIEWLSPDQINKLSSDPQKCTQSKGAIRIDMRKPFVPEEYTQLYFTPVYASLHHEHRLRYNQLSGLRINEYIMMLEADLIERLLVPLRHHPRVRNNPALIQSIETMVEEERRHYQYFAALNRSCRPDLYPEGQDRRFSRVPVWTKAMFRTAGLLANRLAFSLWYLMAMEESSMALARDMTRRPETETLGALDPAFASVHQEHMKDEARHLHVDGILIDLTIGASERLRRVVNAKLFQAMLSGITTPTRGGSGVKVIHQLVREMPELTDRKDELIRAVLSLKSNKAFQESLFNRRIMPVTFKVFDQTSELADLGDRMAGYDRR
ncbi:MAG: diiron oxygenase [Hyphomicrobium sp.]